MAGRKAVTRSGNPAPTSSRSRPAHHMERRALLCTRLGEYERPGGEVERGEIDPASEPCRGRSPVETARDHEVDDEEELVFELDHDALSEPAEPENRLPLQGAEGWLDGAKEKRARQPNAAERLSNEVRDETLDVDDDVGQLGHARPRVERPAARVTRLDPTGALSAR